MAPHSKIKRRYPFKRTLSRKIRRIAFMLIAAVLASAVNYYNDHSANKHSTIEDSSRFQDTLTQKNSTQFSKGEQQQAVSKIRNAKNNTNAQFWVGFNADIIQKLKDDNTGSRHQKFLISPASGVTLLVAHNIDLASRVPIKKGDTISLYGRYEWNNRGGVIHWTHHDPKGKKKGGWIKANGKIYR